MAWIIIAHSQKFRIKVYIFKAATQKYSKLSTILNRNHLNSKVFSLATSSNQSSVTKTMIRQMIRKIKFVILSRWSKIKVKKF